ncbi:MAG TPA: 30S ribosomal protein S9 [Desulfobacteraceae bacterium]|nr:30S ribosomal protein S9 [Desulfobacteraceae bacterium]
MAAEQLNATGKRKTAVARVRLTPGKGNVTINNRPIDHYLVRESDRIYALEPLKVTELSERFDCFVNVRGGGLSGQAGAIRHGISRALTSKDPELRTVFKKHGFLTRDDRMKERKKYGQPGARAKYQYSKR